MFFQRPPRNGFGLGTNFNQDPLGNSLIAETRPQPRPQPVMMNTGYPVLDLIAGLGQVFNREPMTTPPYIPPQQGGDWGMGQNDNGSIVSGGIFGPMVIEENPQPKPRPEYDIWGNPIERYPMDERPSPKEKYAFDFPKIWNDDTEQQDWLNRWDIQPANDARYLPTFPEPDDTSTGAAIRRDWHNSYKDFAKNTIGQYAPMFAEQMPQPQPQQSYGDFMGEIKNTASTLVNSAASQLGGGLGQALSFIPGLGPIMELIGQGANIASTVAGATGLGGEKAGAALNLIGSVANGAAGGAATSGGTEEFGPPMPSGEGGMFSGLRPNQQPSPTAPSTPPFKPQPAPAVSDGEGNWFKPLDQMFKEIDERQARGETFDEKTNSWTKPVPITTEQPKSVVFKKPGQDSVIDPSVSQAARDAVNKYQSDYNPQESKNPLDQYYDKQLPKPEGNRGLSSYEQTTIDWLKDRENMNATSKDLAPHQPSEASGVTIGYGYDFKGRTPEQVQKDLERAGFPQDQIDLYKQATGKSTFSADKFIRENADKFQPITKQQADVLLRQDPKLDEAFRRVDQIEKDVPLTINQKNALVSLGYNVPVALSEKSSVIKNLRKGDQISAAKAFELYNQSGGEVLKGLVNRRALERDLFLKVVNPK